MCASPVSSWNTANLWCTGSKRIRQAVWPIQSETFMLKCRVQKRCISATSGASTPMWPNSVMPAARPKRPGGSPV